MKSKLLLFLWIPILVFSSCKSYKGYKIDGTVKNGDGVPVFLEDLSSDDLAILDTATVVNGKFQLKNYAPDGLYRLRFGDKQAIFLYIHEKDEISISADLDNLFGYTLTGSPDCQTIKDLTVEVDRQLSAQDAMYMNVQQTEGPAKDSLVTVLNKSRQDYIAYIKQFVSSTPNKEIAAFALNFLGPSIQQEIPYLIEVTESLHQAEPNSKFINRWYTSLQQYRDNLLANEATGIGIGTVAPNIILQDPDGDSIQLKSLQGKIVLLDFWASWCGPCRQENPNVVRLYKKFHPKGLEIFSVSLDSNRDPWVKAIKTDGLIWPYHGSDFGGWGSKPAKDYQVESIPQTYLLDQSGKVIAKNLRGELLEQKLEEIFSVPPVQ
jgi:thiol-disulfide isomerase/thioredoxin